MPHGRDQHTDRLRCSNSPHLAMLAVLVMLAKILLYLDVVTTERVSGQGKAIGRILRLISILTFKPADP